MAIGLNGLARQVDAGSGEVLFVDYNTPDHLPTLPELIWDTLTRQARRRLRILRVRPAQHARFADRTPLPVLEPVARNVALRRANPANRWILSTNTDALLLEPGKGSELIGFVATLALGQYGLPRFELPERAWEGFVRNDPEGCIALARAWGREARLREIVRGVPDVLFDNPGDFQLLPREDVVAIGGFEEEMLLGWHVDHNLAKRMAVRLGAIRSLEDRLELYHLGHSRSVVPSHAHDRIENDIVAFVQQIDRPEALHEANGWGLAKEHVEEIRLDVAPGEIVRAACREVMAPLEGAPLEARYAPESFDRDVYDSGHVAAHLFDLLSTFPPSAIFAFAGLRRDLLDKVREGLGKLGFKRRLLVPRSLAEQLSADALPDVQVGDDEAVLRAADALVFAFGAESSSSDLDGGPSLSIADLFDRAAAIEDGRLIIGDAPRLFIVVGAVHSRVERRVCDRLAAAASPFTTRLRYGPLTRGASDADQTARHRRRSRAARRWIPILEAGDELPLRTRCILAAEALAVRRELDAIASDEPSRATAERIRARLDDAVRPAPALAGRRFAPPSVGPRLSGLARADSWDRPLFATEARRLSDVRNGWVWERAQLLTGLAVLSGPMAESQVLALIEHDEPLLETLALRCGRLHVLDTRLFGAADPEPTSATFSLARGASTVTPGDLAGAAYDIVVAPQSALFRDGVRGAATRLASLCASLRPGGVLAIGGEVCLVGHEREMRPSLSMACADGLPSACAKLFGLRLERDDGWGLLPDDLARIGSAADNADGTWLLGVTQGDDVLWPAVWFFTKCEARVHSEQESVQAVFSDLFLGEQIEAMALGSGAHRGGTAIMSGDVPGHFAFGPYLALAPGRYMASLVLATSGCQHRPRGGDVVVEVAFGDAVVAQDSPQVAAAGGQTVCKLRFTAPGGAAQCEFRVWSSGRVPLRIESVCLERA
ncbi:MAG: hypothetical protein AB7L90_22080 [Hyphomicrobiaceae bacterium]